MAKEISFSDFLKEGALQEERAVIHDEALIEKPIRIEAEEVASEIQIKTFWKKLRHFFRTGERPEGRNGLLVPALLAPQLKKGSWESDYPVYIPSHEGEVVSVSSLVEVAMGKLFKPTEARILRKNLPRIEHYFQESIAPGTAWVDFHSAKSEMVNRISKLEVHGEEGERFKNDLVKFSEALPNDGMILAFHHESPLYILKHQLNWIDNRRKEFSALVDKKIVDLKELLAQDLQKKSGKEDPGAGYDFAQDMITLEKVEEMSRLEGTEAIPEDRILHINTLISELEGGLSKNTLQGHIVYTPELQTEFEWDLIFDNCALKPAELTDAFGLVERDFDKRIKEFTRFFANVHQADLELAGKYEEDVHGDYYAHYKWFKLSEEELGLFPPSILITGAAHLLRDDMAGFSHLLVANKPLKLFAITNRTVNEVNPDIDWEDASHGFRQELAAIAISHRSSHTLQCAADLPYVLSSGIQKAIASPTPALMHILVPAKGQDTHVLFLKINAAVDGRYFPNVEYDCVRGNQWGSRFDISTNPQPEKDWPEFSFSYVDIDGEEVTAALNFTYADYKAITSEKVEELFLVPDAYATDYLIPVSEYLRLPSDQLSGKVPYIWLVDEDNKLKRAAIPYMWAVSCKERLDFWNFIQELGGVNSYHVREALRKARVEWDEEKNAEIEALKTNHQRDLENTRKNAGAETMDRLVNVLLNLDEVPVSKPSVRTAKAAVEAESNVEKGNDNGTEAPREEPEPEEEISAEPWIESFRCTSCNDCIEKFPAVFKYNEDKQAYVNDASKGTFEQLVIAAEACPAKCIHPGAPTNPEEPNLKELIERASKFN